MPWTALNYDSDLGGYRVNLTKKQLEDAPKYTESQGWNWIGTMNVVCTSTIRFSRTGNNLSADARLHRVSASSL
jgi:hypothetical protein